MSVSERRKHLLQEDKGIGRAVAEALASEGYDLYLTCHEQIGRLDSLAEELWQKYGIKCYCYAFSICDEEKSNSDVPRYSVSDILVNNAGISYIGLLTEMTYQQWREVIDTNLNACFLTCHSAVPQMVRRHCGKIINISSVWGMSARRWRWRTPHQKADSMH